MINAKRRQNEKQYKNWNDKEAGGRIYWFEITGRLGWSAKYVKEVNNAEETISFRQEIYDENGILREIHEKYPVDKGHQKLF